jgi:hypothetical protein
MTYTYSNFSTVGAQREPMYALMFVLLGLSFCVTLLMPLTRLQWQFAIPTVLLCGLGLDKLAHLLARAVRRGVTGDEA